MNPSLISVNWIFSFLCCAIFWAACKQVYEENVYIYMTSAKVPKPRQAMNCKCYGVLLMCCRPLYNTADDHALELQSTHHSSHDARVFFFVNHFLTIPKNSAYRLNINNLWSWCLCVPSVGCLVVWQYVTFIIFALMFMYFFLIWYSVYELVSVLNNSTWNDFAQSSLSGWSSFCYTRTGW